MVATVGRCYTNPQDYAQENYYTQGQGLTNSEWLGKAAENQGLNGQIQEKYFYNAYQALDPDGNPLRKQQNYRKQSKRQNRPGTDVTLSAPKSISVAALVFGDQQILEAHQAAVRATMEYVENHCIFYQVKQRGQKLLLQSKTAQIAVFHHDDNRNKDPQLHSHCVILNQTLCPDQKWRAVANSQLYVQQKTIGAYYAHELARNLKEIGWAVEWTDDHTFELAGVDKEKFDAVFSTRSNQIEAELAQLGLTRKTATAEQKQALCLKTRPQKRYHLHPEDRERQLEEWRSRAQEAGIALALNGQTRLAPIDQQPPPSSYLPELLDQATEILTERQTAFQQHELLKECLRHSQGKYEAKQIETQIAQFPQLVPTQDGRLTTAQQLKREQKLVNLAKSGRNSREPLASQEQAIAIALSKNLNKGQTAALIHLATSPDAVVLVQGNAGVGKTYTMKALKDLVDAVILDKETRHGDFLAKADNAIGKQGEIFTDNLSSYSPVPASPHHFPPFTQIRGLAPSAAAADVLQHESGISSQTLTSYLLTSNERLPKNEVLLVDEAGMLSSKQIEQLLEKAQATNSRMILVGDTKQLSAVEAGAPFKLLQEQGLPTAIIDQNLRQRDCQLKQVVDLMATHDKDPDSVNRAYQQLNRQGKIQQIPPEGERFKAIACDYLSRPPEVRDRTLILAGTNADKQAISTAVRQDLNAEGVLGNESISVQTLRRKDIDKFALTQAHHYQRGDVIKFQTESSQFSRDFYYRVTAVNPEANTVSLIDTAGVDYTLPLDKYKQREVYQVQPLEICPGERMRFTKNIRTPDYQQLNGQRFTVEGLTDEGQVTIVTKGKTLEVSPSQLLHSDYRYVDTVHSSQGQTADYCIYSASPAKSLTIGRESFYVAASRAKQEFVVYTASVQDLGVTVQISRTNENALDLVKSSPSREKENEEYLNRERKIEEERDNKQLLNQNNKTEEQRETKKHFNRDKKTEEQSQKSHQLLNQSTVLNSLSSVKSPQEFLVKSEPSTKQLQLTDAKLITLIRAVQQWKKSCPSEPNSEQGKRLKQKFDDLESQKAFLKQQLLRQQKELQQMGKPRSLFNPLGAKAEDIDALKIEMGITKLEISHTDRELSQAASRFQKWQKEVRAYLSWLESPQTKEMNQLAEELKSPFIQERIQRLKEGYAVYEQAQYILKILGEPKENPNYFQGKVYAISKQGKTLTITQKDSQESLFVATDKRESGGIIEISQFKFTPEDQKMIQDSALYLEKQLQAQQQKNRSQGFSLD